MLQFGYNTGVINAPESVRKHTKTNKQHTNKTQKHDKQISKEQKKVMTGKMEVDSLVTMMCWFECDQSLYISHMMPRKLYK